MCRSGRHNGSPAGPFSVAVQLDSEPDAVVAAVSRYSGVDPVNPVENPVGSNTNGEDDASCSGGEDNASPTLNTNSTIDNAVHFVGLAPRHKTVETADGDYAQRAYLAAGSGGDTAGLYIFDYGKANAGADLFTAGLNSSTDWAAAGLVLRPR